jgi:pimeloyl-ACP methyl ester carboxylesterase
VAESYEEELAAITCRTFLVGGAHDTASPPHLVERAAGMLADCEVLLGPDSAHLLDADLNALIGTALDRADQ